MLLERERVDYPVVHGDVKCKLESEDSSHHAKDTPKDDSERTDMELEQLLGSALEPNFFVSGRDPRAWLHAFSLLWNSFKIPRDMAIQDWSTERRVEIAL